MVFYCYTLMCLIFGTTFLAIKVGINGGFAPLMFAGLRFGAAAIIILMFLWIRKSKFPTNLSTYINLAYVGICMTGVTFAALYWAEQFISSGVAALLSATGPLMVLFISFLFEKRKLSLPQFVGVLLGILGVYLIVLPNLKGGISSTWLQGALAIVGAELFYALGAVRSRKVLSSGVDPFMMNGFQMLFGSLALVVSSLIFETHAFKIVEPTKAILSLLYLIIIGSIVAQGIYYWLVKMTNPLFPSTWLYISPVIALFVGYLVLSEAVHPISILGSIAVLGGVYLTNYQQLKGLFLQRVRDKKIKVSS